MSKEYTYDIDKYTIGVDTNGEDGIGMTVAKIENGELHFLGNCYGENARCIDLLIKENKELKKKYENAVADYETTMAEKEQLKKQLEKKYSKIGTFTNEVLYEENTKLINQQQEFINYLEESQFIPSITGEDFEEDYTITEILQKYKSIIGGNKDEK